MENNVRPSILAIGAHAGDMEISVGPLLLKHKKNNFAVNLLHLTAGEKGSATIPPDEFRKIKEEQALQCAEKIGAEVTFGPFKDGEIPGTEDAKLYICDMIRQLKPSILITHWKNSIHKDHENTNRIVLDGIFYAAMPSIKRDDEAHQTRRLYFAENWEDKEGFTPYIYSDVSDEMDVWENAIMKYDLYSGNAPFPYVNYYKAQTIMRGAESGFMNAVALDIDQFGKKIRMDLLG